MADRPPGDFGRTLREARERRGLSLRQIATKTKIGLNALEALERNDISRLPGGIFSRSFVRSYAIEVGLDPEVAIQEFIAQFPLNSVTAGHPTSDRSEDHLAIESDRRSATTFVRLIAISVPIAGAILYFSSAERRAASRAPQATPAAAARTPVEVSSVVEAPSPVVAPPAVGGPSPVAAIQAIPAPAVAVPPALERAKPPVREAVPEPVVTPVSAAAFPSDRLTVTLSAIVECLVSATVDGEKTVDRLLQPGEQLTIEVYRELVLTAGDPSALAITLNGAEAKPLGKAGEAATARLNLTNFKDYVANR